MSKNAQNSPFRHEFLDIFRHILVKLSKRVETPRMMLLLLLEKVADFGKQQLFFCGLRLFGRRLRFGGLFELLLRGVERLDHQEDDERDENKINDRRQERADADDVS